MLENLMIASIFITTMMTLIVLGLLVLAAFYFGMDYICRGWGPKYGDRDEVIEELDEIK